MAGPGRRMIMGATLAVVGLAAAAVVGWRSFHDGARGRYTVTKLGEGAPRPVRVNGINNRGVAIGCASLPDNSHSCYLYADGVATKVEMPGATDMLLTAVNDRGQVAGRFIAPDRHGYQGVLFDGGRATPFFATPPGGVTVPSGLDGTGRVVGLFRRDGADATGRPLTSGFLYQDGVITTLDYPGSRYTDAVAVNDKGVVVGNHHPMDGTGRHGFIYESGSYRKLDVPGAALVEVKAVNNAGQVAGTWMSDDMVPHVFLYDNGRVTSFDVPQAQDVVRVVINNGGTIAGYGLTRDERDGFFGFLIAGGVVEIDPGGIKRFQIEAINDAGQLVGLGVVRDRSVGLLATPYPGPGR